MRRLLAGAVVLGYFISKNFTRPILRLVNYRVDDIIEKKNPKDIWLRAQDGIKLHARYIPGGEEHVILLHGYHSSPSRDFSTMIPYYLEKGYSLLLPDVRSHGKSGGNLITFGAKESLDAKLWIDFLVGSGVKRMLIHGVSMGAATTLLLRTLDLPEEVELMILDCPYIDAYDQILDSAGKKGKVMPTITPPFCSLLGVVGLQLKEILPYQGLGKIGVPMLMIHGTGDHFVKARNTVRAYVDSDEEKEIHLFKHAPHARSMKMYPKEYKEVVENFLAKHNFLRED